MLGCLAHGGACYAEVSGQRWLARYWLTWTVAAVDRLVASLDDLETWLLSYGASSP
jgi:hypothetical protein